MGYMCINFYYVYQKESFWFVLFFKLCYFYIISNLTHNFVIKNVP